MTPRRTCLLATLVALSTAAVAAPVATADVLASEDATELAQLLADASEEQGVCYGWHAVVDDQGSEGLSSDEAGSSFGPDTPLSSASTDDCSALVQLDVVITYTSEYSESEDYAYMTVTSSRGSISEEDLGRLGYDEGDLLGDDDDVALFNLVAGLPLLAAEAGIADPVQFEPPTQEEQQEAADERPTDSPGSDWWRMYWWVPILILPIGGLALLVLVRWIASLRARSSVTRPDRTR